MIETAGRVVRVQGDTAWVETGGASSCGGCAANPGCGVALLSRIFGGRRNYLRVLNPICARTGDRVIIAMREDALLRGSCAMYLVPLAGLLGGAILGYTAGETELFSILSALFGLSGGVVWLRRYGRRMRDDARYEVRVLRQVSE